MNMTESNDMTPHTLFIGLILTLLVVMSLVVVVLFIPFAPLLFVESVDILVSHCSDEFIDLFGRGVLLDGWGLDPFAVHMDNVLYLA